MDRPELGVLALLTKRFTELQAAFRTLSKQAGPAGKDGKDGISVTGAAGKDGKDGRDGKDGKSIKGDPGKDGVDGKDGEQGPVGHAPKHRWKGTKLQFEKPDGEWGRAVDLKGEPGKDSGVTKVVGIGGGGNFDPTTTPVALTLVAGDEMLIVREGVLMRIAVSLSGGTDPTVVTINGEPVTINGELVRITQ